MAAKPKLTPEQWADVQHRWEHDPREGYLWLVEELDLPVSAPAVRKTAVRDGWYKKASLHLPGEKASQAMPSEKPSEKPSEQNQAVEKPSEKPSKPLKNKGKAPESRASKVSPMVSAKVSQRRNQRNHAETAKIEKPSETISETLPVTTAQAVARAPDEFGVFTDLSDMQELFVREYLVDWNATAAATRAGYSPKAAMQQGWALLQMPKVHHAITTLASARARRLGIDADELMRLWAAIVTFDANEISQLRRVCCPYCWGENHQRQYTPSGLEEAQKKHDRERARRMKADQNDDIGEFPAYTDDWYDKRKPPVEDCPECHGEGIEEVFFNDTRNLSPAARLVYCGVDMGKDGIKVLMLSKEKAMDNLARALGLFKEKDVEVNINMVSGDELYRLYEDKMKLARTRQTAVLTERGIVIEADH